MGVFTVYLDRIANLRDSDTLGKSDPYVKFELEQDNFVFDKGFGKQISSKKKNDLNPEYGETFTFKGVPSMNNIVLHVKVMDDDIGFDDEIGSAKISMEKLGLTKVPKEIERVIDHKKGGGWFSRKAKIYLKVSFDEGGE